MNFRISLLLFFFAVPFSCAQDKIATVNIKRVFDECHTIKAEESRLQADLVKFQQDPRIKHYQEKAEKLSAEREQLMHRKGSPEERKKKLREFNSKINELKSLGKDRREYQTRKQNELKKRIVRISQENIKRIQAAIKTYAKEKGYALVLESEGVTNSKIPALIYVRKADDITEAIIKLVNKNAPPEKDSSVRKKTS